MWGEGMARLYWDKHGIESVCVRIGSAIPKPTEFRHLSTWFGLDDLLDFTMRCIETPRVGYVVVLGRVEQHAQLLGANQLRGARLLPEAELRGLCGGDPEPAQSVERNRAALSRRQLRRDGLHPGEQRPGQR